MYVKVAKPIEPEARRTGIRPRRKGELLLLRGPVTGHPRQTRSNASIPVSRRNLLPWGGGCVHARFLTGSPPSLSHEGGGKRQGARSGTRTDQRDRGGAERQWRGVGWGFTPPSARGLRGGWWGGTPPYACWGEDGQGTCPWHMSGAVAPVARPVVRAAVETMP